MDFTTNRLRESAHALPYMGPSGVAQTAFELMQWADEIDALRIYAECLARGLSDSEARGTAWPE